MKRIIIIFTVFCLISICFAKGPMDLLIVKNQPREMINLRNIDPNSSISISMTNEKLRGWQPIEIDNLGHYNSNMLYIKQDINYSDSQVIEKFLSRTNESENIVDVNQTSNESLPYY